MTTVPLSKAKARLSQIADEVHRTHERVTLTEDGRSCVVLMSESSSVGRLRRALADRAGLAATLVLELLRDAPQVVQDAAPFS